MATCSAEIEESALERRRYLEGILHGLIFTKCPTKQTRAVCT